MLIKFPLKENLGPCRFTAKFYTPFKEDLAPTTWQTFPQTKGAGALPNSAHGSKTLNSDTAREKYPKKPSYTGSLKIGL